MTANHKEVNAKIFECLGWAGYLSEWPGPADGERPSAYIIILGDTSISKTFQHDVGIAAQSILLGATENDYGGCMIGTINRKKLRAHLNIDEKFDIELVIALGKPNETIVLEKAKDNDIKYWRDKEDVHHVPKRDLDELIIKC